MDAKVSLNHIRQMVQTRIQLNHLLGGGPFLGAENGSRSLRAAQRIG